MTPSQTQVAVLGLGIVGSRCAARLVADGWTVRTWNRTPKGTAQETTTPQDAVRGAAVISIYLKDAPALRAVIETIGDELTAGQTILNHATIDLDTTNWLAEFCRTRACRFLDCPFTGSKLAAANGELVYYTGGDPALVAELEPMLAVTSKERLHCGDVGSATVIKLATNLLSASVIEATAEALAISRSHGVDPQILHQAITRNVSHSKLVDMKLPQMLAGNYDTHFSLSNMAKDGRYMLELAKSAGVETPSIAATSRRMDELCAQGLGDLDYSALAKPYLEEKLKG